MRSATLHRSMQPFQHLTRLRSHHPRAYATTRLGRIDLGSSSKANAHNPSPKANQPPSPGAKPRGNLWKKAVELVSNTGYLAVILAGVGLGGISLSYLVSDAVEAHRANKLFEDALDKVQRHEKVIDMIGLPMKGHGPLGPRGGATKVTRTIYKDKSGNENMIVMYFHLEGPSGKGTVYVNQTKNAESGEFEYNVLSADVMRQGQRDGTAKRIILIDNRNRRRSDGKGKRGWLGVRPIWRSKEE
ncbi:TIM21-domain-containing protein [Chytriomyces sp. MP71]|nr:TIM21-domain-containing protein [Chytriomyces sp. MP71]